MSDIQRDWRWCNKCQGVFFSGNTLPNYCPAGGGHSYDANQQYGLPQQRPSGEWLDQWRWCNKCQGLFWIHDGKGLCPDASLSKEHDDAGSGTYFLALAPILGVTFPSFRYCNRCAGLWNITQPSTGFCPAGGGHASTGSGKFYV